MMTKLEEAAALNDPSIKAKPLTLRLKGLWSFRIAGGYRVIADIQRDKLVIFAVAVGARKDVYDI